MATPIEKLRQIQLLKTNPAMAQFQALQELKAMALEQVETLFLAHKNQIEREMMEYIKGFDPINSGFIDKIVNKTVAQLVKDAKGDTGYTPQRGLDYFTDEDIDRFIRTIESNIVIPRDGIDGETPKAGVDYPTTEQVREQVMQQISIAVARIPKAMDGKTPLKGVDYFTEKDVKDVLARLKQEYTISGEEVVRKINALEIVPAKQIDASHIKNLPKLLKDGVRRAIHRGGGQLVVDNFTSLTDGSTKTFTLSKAPGTSNVLVCSTQFPVIFDPATDYTVSGTTLTLSAAVSAPSTSQTLIAIYTN